MSSATNSFVTFEKERASPRFPLTIPIVMRGKDSNGTSIIEKTHTVVVNQRGAKVLTSNSFTLGAPLEVAVPHLKSHSSARVAWLGPRDSDFQAIGIDLGRCGDFWGMGMLETPPATKEEIENRNGNTSSTTGGSTVDKKNGNHVSALPSAGSSQNDPRLQADQAANLSIALEGLVRTAIEKSLREILPRVNREAEEQSHELIRVAIEQIHAQTQRLVEEGLTKFETQIAETLAQRETNWQQTLQQMTQTTQERLEATVLEYQAGLAKKAESVRHELARKLADLGTKLEEA